MLNLNEATQRIKKAGANNVRAVPMPGADVHTGAYRIEINEGNAWITIVESLPRSTAQDLIAQATNRVICG
jgi:negative regulator of sigma E activity